MTAETAAAPAAPGTFNASEYLLRAVSETGTAGRTVFAGPGGDLGYGEPAELAALLNDARARVLLVSGRFAAAAAEAALAHAPGVRHVSAKPDRAAARRRQRQAVRLRVRPALDPARRRVSERGGGR